MFKFEILAVGIISVLLNSQAVHKSENDWKIHARYAVGLIIQKDGYFITEGKFSISEYLAKIKFADQELVGGTTVYFTNQSFSAEDIRELCGLKQIDSLMFVNCDLSPGALVPIPQLSKSLTKLWFNDTRDIVKCCVLEIEFRRLPA